MRPDTLLTSVIQPALQALRAFNPRIATPAAEILLLGTAAHESHLGVYNEQVGGPALGLMQIEPTTHTSVWENYIQHRPSLFRIMDKNICQQGSPIRNRYYYRSPEFHSQLVWNWRYNVAIARILYWQVPEPMPEGNDLPGLAQYWKDHYNTARGKGTVDEWLECYDRLVLNKRRAS